MKTLNEIVREEAFESASSITNLSSTNPATMEDFEDWNFILSLYNLAPIR